VLPAKVSSLPLPSRVSQQPLSRRERGWGEGIEKETGRVVLRQHRPGRCSVALCVKHNTSGLPTPPNHSGLHLPEQLRPQPCEPSIRRPSGSTRSSQRWKSTQPAQSTANPRLAQRYPHTAQAALNRPAKPMKAMDRMPAIMRLMAVPRISLGTGAVSDSSRSPAMSTRARVKPSPAPKA